MGFLLLAFIGIPIAEIALFLYVGERIGLVATLVIIVATAVVGSALVARQGSGALNQVQSAFSEARFPGRELAHGAMIVVAGAFLVTPGFLTDGLGFLLLVPPIREVARGWFVKRFSGRTTVQFGPQPVDAEWHEADPPDEDAPRPLS
ncbi:MAG: FxsA family protein [Acidimicrobiia bacterium]|nr:FxsA family protein [Acidimicrobiia bacterium]